MTGATALNNVPARALRVLLAPDSFKGSLDAPAVARHMACGIRHAPPHAVVTQVPIADGGEGTAAAAQLVRLYAAARRSA